MTSPEDQPEHWPPRRSPNRDPQVRYSWRRLAVLVALFALGGFVLASMAPAEHWDTLRSLYAFRYLLLLVFVILGLASTRQRLSAMALQLGAWSLIMIMLVAGYGYRAELQDVAQRLTARLTAELMPAQGVETTPGIVRFGRAMDGQFWINAKVDGENLRFLLDTGASGVVLSLEDAEKLGYDPDRLAFTQQADTANGTTREAPILLNETTIGSIRFTRVPATVTAGGLHNSLLGMHLLERLSSLEIRKDTLTIRE
jgi:aspartyl protease family protein